MWCNALLNDAFRRAGGVPIATLARGHSAEKVASFKGLAKAILGGRSIVTVCNAVHLGTGGGCFPALQNVVLHPDLPRRKASAHCGSLSVSSGNQVFMRRIMISWSRMRAASSRPLARLLGQLRPEARHR
jgi:hypothetical protein